MADKEKDRDWDKEMAEVDRLLKKLPYAEPHPSRIPSSAPSEKRPAVAGEMLALADAGGGRGATWARVGLGLLVGIAMPLWPYAHACGFKLFLYLGGVLTVIVAGLWGGLSSWKRRMGFAHLLAQGLILWGLVLAAREVLPRVGYAKAATTWFCP